MRLHKLTGLKKQEGVILEIEGYIIKVARYTRHYGEYIEDEVLHEGARLYDYMTEKEANSFKKPSIRTIVKRVAEDICPDEADVYFEIIF